MELARPTVFSTCGRTERPSRVEIWSHAAERTCWSCISWRQPAVKSRAIAADALRARERIFRQASLSSRINVHLHHGDRGELLKEGTRLRQ